MPSDASEDLTVSRSTAPALPAASTGPGSLPALYAPDPRAVEFFTAHIRNPHTRKAYAETAAGFATWCDRVVLHRHKAPKRGSAGIWGRVAPRKRLR